MTTATRRPASIAAFAIGIALNIAFVAVEAFYGWKVNSLALLADAGHNLSDVLASCWPGVARWPATAAGRAPHVRLETCQHPRRLRQCLASAGGDGFAGLGGLAPAAVARPIEGVTIMVVAGIGIVVNTVTALLFMRGGDRDLNIRGAFLHMAADALVSAGVVVAGGLQLWFGWNWLDPVVSLVIAAVIVVGTSSLFKQSVHLMFDGVPEGVDLHAVQALLEALPGVARVHDLHVWAMGTLEIAMTAHLVMPDGHADDAFLQNATRQLHDRFEIEHVTIRWCGSHSRSPVPAWRRLLQVGNRTGNAWIREEHQAK